MDECHFSHTPKLQKKKNPALEFLLFCIGEGPFLRPFRRDETASSQAQRNAERLKWSRPFSLYIGEGPVLRPLQPPEIWEASVTFNHWARKYNLGRETFCRESISFSWLRKLEPCRASPRVRSMWACKNISHIPSLVISFFATLPIRLKHWLQIVGNYFQQTTWTNYYDWPIKNKEQQSDPIYYTLLQQQVNCCTLYQHEETEQISRSTTTFLS